jgi:hypothetical protein
MARCDEITGNAVALTVLTAQKPSALSKSFTLTEDGTLQKHPGGQLIRGTAQRHSLSYHALCVLLARLEPNQALTFGVCAHDTALVVSQKNLDKTNATLPVVARDRAHFTWPSGPGALMLDYDPPKDAQPLNREALLEALYEVWPALRDAPHIWRESASSCIYRTDTGEQLRGVAGQRVYVPVRDAQDIPRAGAALYARLWLAGQGRFDISASGALLDRTLVDGSVWQPERLDFAGGARCGPGLEQRREEPKLFNGTAVFVDSRSLADLDPIEKARLETLKAEAKDALRPAREAKQAEWIEERLATYADDKKPAMRDVLNRAVKDKRLLGDFVLHLEKQGRVAVATILDNPSKYHNARCADPLEPEYGNDRRIAWINLKAAGKPYLFSHAHGGQRFTLHRALQTLHIEGGELQTIAGKLLELMRLDGVVFARGNELVRLADDTAYPVSADWLVWYLTGLAHFEKWDGRKEAWKAVDCPLSLARSICALSGSWNLPELAGVLTAPAMTPQGRIIETEGFDDPTGLYLHFMDSEDWQSIPANPDLQTAKTAVDTLCRPFKEFPFVKAVDRGGFFAALLTALVRPLLPTAPGFLIKAPVAGSGKTLLALCVAALTGAHAGVTSAGRDEEELEKRLLTELRSFSRCIIFDNLARPLESESLCSFLTTPYFSGRLLGSNSSISARPVAVVILTGNNPTIIGDLNRRLIRIDIDPACEKPHDRCFDIEPLSYVQEHRLELVRAGLVILKAALMRGFKHKGGRLASFEVWSDFIRNAVIWIGEEKLLEVADPALSLDAGFDSDPLTTRLAALLEAWSKSFPSGATVAQAIRLSQQNEAFLELLLEVAGERGQVPPRRLGNWIAKFEKRIVNNMYFVRMGDEHRAVKWCVQKVSLGEFQGSFSAVPGNCQNDILYRERENTFETHPNSPSCQTCASCLNFSPSELNPRGAGVCERSPDGCLSKLPTDGAGCGSFEWITH